MWILGSHRNHTARMCFRGWVLKGRSGTWIPVCRFTASWLNLGLLGVHIISEITGEMRSEWYNLQGKNLLQVNEDSASISQHDRPWRSQLAVGEVKGKLCLLIAPLPLVLGGWCPHLVACVSESQQDTILGSWELNPGGVPVEEEWRAWAGAGRWEPPASIQAGIWYRFPNQIKSGSPQDTTTQYSSVHCVQRLNTLTLKRK